MVVIVTLILFASGLLQVTQALQVEKFELNDDTSEIGKAELSYQYYIFIVIITISTLGFGNPFSWSTNQNLPSHPYSRFFSDNSSKNLAADLYLLFKISLCSYEVSIFEPIVY